MSLVLNVEILGEFRNLTKATQGSQSELNKLNKKITGFSNSAKKAFASIGVGLSFAFIARELDDATKAAVEDRKSTELLADALRKTTDVTDEQIKSVERQISKMSLIAGIADDDIRPAFANLVRSTGDVTKASDLMTLALDISAGTGKDLESVSKALSRAVGPEGTMGALEKLVPAIKGTHDPLGKLHDLFDGNAKLAADQDPYKRLQVVLGEVQEKVGTALLPVLDTFSKWLASPGGTEALKLVSDAIVQILKDAIAVAKWVVANKNWVLPLATGIGAITSAWKIATAAAETYAAIAGAATALGAGGGAAGLLKKIPVGVGIGLGALGTAAGILSLGGDTAKAGTSGSAAARSAIPSATASPQRYAAYMAGLSAGAPSVGTNQLNTKSTSSGITVNVTQAVTAKTIIDTVSAYQKSTGTTLAQALR